MQQLWNLDGNRGIQVRQGGVVSISCGKSVFLPPQQWTRIFLPYKISVVGGVTLTCGLSRRGLVSGLSVTKGGQLGVNVLNTTEETIHLTPRTTMVNVMGARVSIRYFGKEAKWVCATSVEKMTSDYIRDRIISSFPNVGDLSSHPIKECMQKMVIKSTEVSWSEPRELGLRTQYTIENVSDRRLVKEQLEAYIRRGYLKEVSVSEKVYLSPLLPVKKPNGTYRFTNDFRKLNSYFQGIGTTQVDVWRKLWEIDPTWRFFMEIDLKDGFFGVPVDDTLSRLFGFTFGDRRFRWVRLP